MAKISASNWFDYFLEFQQKPKIFKFIKQFPEREMEPISEITPHDYFRKSKIKESQIVVAEACCSRHLYCIHSYDQAGSEQNNSFSINSELLAEFTPLNLSADPLIEYQFKPEVDMLAQMNIKKKQYQTLLQKCEHDIEKEEKEKRLEKIQLQAKTALEKSKKIANSPKRKWGHSIFSEDKMEKKDTEMKQSKKEVAKKPIEMKPITQRIAEYKRQQLTKQQQEAEKYNRKHREVNTKDLQAKIESNAAKLLEQIKLDKLKKEEQKKIIEAKIRALQLKSLQKVKHCKKKPFEGGQEFNLGDSQYSTFSARANNRKLEKKKKKEKPKPVKDEQNTGKKTHNFLRKSSQSSKPPSQKMKTQQIVTKQQESIKENQKQQIKGPYFIWNIPVQQNQLEKIEYSNDKVFMNIQRLNQKSGKTFREEANQFLTRKMEKKMAERREEAKKHNFMMQVEAKKQDLLRTFDRQQGYKAMEEPFWNEDEVFKPNIYQNFHFYEKKASPN